MATAENRLACRACGELHEPQLLACPRCRALVHKEELQALAAKATAKTEANDLSGALEAWRTALSFLPPESGQHAKIRERITALSLRIESEPAKAPSKGKLAAGAGAIFWILAVGKPLLLGLTKLPTLLSMLVSVAVYWTAFGWKFAVGLIVCIYVHEIGHVVALKRYGIAATSPMFIPGFGAVVRLRQYPNDPREDARVGLAGPRFGLAVSMIALMIGWVAHWPSFLAIGRTSALLNLFNLVPLGSLDGGRGFRALDRTGRFVSVVAIAMAWAWTHETMLAILLVVALFRLAGAVPKEGDRPALVEYVLLVAMLSALTMVKVPGTP